MVKGRLMASWQQTTSMIRIVSLSFTGQEPPLESLVPAVFRPKVKELTEEEKKLIRAKAELDVKIMRDLAAKGIKPRVKRGTPG